MKISTPIMVMAIALPAFSFTQVQKKHSAPSGKLEMRLSFPLIKKKFGVCKDSSLLARIVIYNRTDSLISFMGNNINSVSLNLAFEVETSASKYVVEKKEIEACSGYKTLFPGDSVVVSYLLTSQTCQTSIFTRRIPKPAEGLRSVRAVVQGYTGVDGEDLRSAGYDETNVEARTAPGPDKQRHAIRRDEVRIMPGEVTRSLFKGILKSNVIKF